MCTAIDVYRVATDPLTGICNRRALDESITDKIAMFNRYDSGFTIVIIDIDHFKKVNDEQGHLYGDEILTCVAKLLDQNVRDTDQVTRYGGEEFVIIMPHTPLAVRRSLLIACVKELPH